MERRVKERLIGATILVAVVVLVVPELLSGRRPAADHPVAAETPAAASGESLRTVTVDLSQNPPGGLETYPAPADAQRPASAPTTPATETPVAATPTPAPIEAARDAAPAAHAPTAHPPPQLESTHSTPISPSKTVAAKSAARGGWIVQLGSFENRDNATKLARKWKSKGFAVYVSSVGKGRGARHRVRLGAYPDRAAAFAAASKIEARGGHATVMPPGH